MNAQELRSLGHRAVTEGVNLHYVDLLRQAVYQAADEMERLERELGQSIETERELVAEVRTWIAKYEEIRDGSTA